MDGSIPFYRACQQFAAEWQDCNASDRKSANAGKLEAGTVIEPVYTDLQSRPLARAFNGLGFATYQDKACTTREPDTLTDGTENESPEYRAGSTGAYQLTESFKKKEYRKWARAAIALCAAIAECERDDAVLLMEAAL